MSLINQTKKILEKPRERDKKKDTFCKACTKCSEVLPLTEYHDDARGKYGKEASCKACKKIYLRSWRAANPEKYRESFRDRKSVVQGKSVDLGGRRIIKKKKKKTKKKKRDEVQKTITRAR